MYSIVLKGELKCSNHPFQPVKLALSDD